MTNYHNQTQWQAAIQEAEKHGRLMTWGNVGNAVMLVVVGAVIVVAAVLIGGTP